MFVIDTNVMSELRLPKRADPAVLRWFENGDPETFHLSVVTVMELQFGALRLERRDARQGKTLREWVAETVLSGFPNRILPATEGIALVCASLHVPDQRGERDAWIAATALFHGMTVVTRNVRDFEPMGVSLFNPWEM